MALKASVTGTFALTDDSTNVVAASFDLTTDFGILSSVGEHLVNERDLVDTDGVVALPTGGVQTIRGFMIRVQGGTVTLKHDTNTNGMEISKAMILFGEFSTITVETSATQAIKIKYVLFE